MATVVHSVHCMMGLDSLPATAGTEMSVEEQVDRLFMVRNCHCLKYIPVRHKKGKCGSLKYSYFVCMVK